MTAAEYIELIDLLSCGHELEFNYDGRTYYLEFVGNNTYEFYDKVWTLFRLSLQGGGAEDLTVFDPAGAVV